MYAVKESLRLGRLQLSNCPWNLVLIINSPTTNMPRKFPSASWLWSELSGFTLHSPHLFGRWIFFSLQVGSSTGRPYFLLHIARWIRQIISRVYIFRLRVPQFLTGLLVSPGLFMYLVLQVCKAATSTSIHKFFKIYQVNQ